MYDKDDSMYVSDALDCLFTQKSQINKNRSPELSQGYRRESLHTKADWLTQL